MAAICGAPHSALVVLVLGGLLLAAAPPAAAGKVCTDHTVDGFYASKASPPTRGLPGLPGASFLARPSTLSVCELEQLHTDCVQRINMYRSGECVSGPVGENK